MHVALISPPFLPHFCRSQRWPVVNRTRAQRYPDWLAYAAGVMEEDGFELSMQDSIAAQQSLADVARWTEEHKPQLLVLDATTPSIHNDIQCARMCKQASPGTHITLVGPHVTVYPSDTLSEAAGAVDSIAVGEYDYTLRDLARTLDGGGDAADIAGLSVWRDGAATSTIPRPLIENLDEIPFPPWHFFDVKRYRNNTYLYPYLDQISGRGCPNRCSFCQWPQVMHGRKYRYSSPERVVEEMVENFSRYPIKEIFFEDDTLTVDRQRLRRICELILQQKKRMTWSCNSRVDWADLDTMKLMKEAGCRMLLMGAESGNQRILDGVHKGIRVEQTRKFVSLAKQAKLATHSCWVVGLPGETHETMAQTREFIKELDTDTIQASAVMPQVGTDLYEWAVDKGYLKMASWADYAIDGEQTAVMEYPDLSQKEMNASVNRLLKEFYFQPHVIFRLLRKAITRPALLWSYWTGFVMLLRYLFQRADIVEKK